MDDADRADREDIIREQAIADVRRRKAELPAIGFCHYCSEPVPAGSRFCDADCRDEHETEQRLKAR
jgi:predicted nucleic acid-binding Zn ribbon protein